MKYGSVTKRDLYDAIRITKTVKNQSSKLVIPDMGDSNDWIIVRVGDASNRTNGDVCPAMILYYYRSYVNIDYFA